MRHLDPYRELVGPLHRADARIKVPLCLLFILACASAPTAAWPLFLLLLALVLSLSIVSGLGAAYGLRRSWVAIPFALAAIPLVFTVDGAPAFRLLGWTGTVPGIERAATVLLKSWISVQAAILLSATTRFADTSQALRWMHVPRLLVAMFALMWRYLFVLVDEAERLTQARAARSGSDSDRGGAPLAWRARVTGHMAGTLFIRGYERGERIYDAMAARGYDGEVRSLSAAPLTRDARLMLLFGMVAIAMVCAVGLLL